jgi:hypothetical protein
VSREREKEETRAREADKFYLTLSMAGLWKSASRVETATLTADDGSTARRDKWLTAVYQSNDSCRAATVGLPRGQKQTVHHLRGTEKRTFRPSEA